MSDNIVENNIVVDNYGNEWDLNSIGAALNNKADIDLGNVTIADSVDYVVESYINGSSWYRLYKSGWCEQGGYFTASSAQGIITLLKSYTDEKYVLDIIPHLNGTDGVPWKSFGYDKTSSSFSWGSPLADNREFNWFTSGTTV